MFGLERVPNVPWPKVLLQCLVTRHVLTQVENRISGCSQVKALNEGCSALRSVVSVWGVVSGYTVFRSNTLVQCFSA